MPTVFFEGNLFGPDRRVEVAHGARLVDVCDQALAPVPFSCRAATCGTCRVEVLEGAELLEPREGAEAELFALLGDPPTYRLACQARVGREDGLIRLRVAGDEIRLSLANATPNGRLSTQSTIRLGLANRRRLSAFIRQATQALLTHAGRPAVMQSVSAAH